MKGAGMSDTTDPPRSEQPSAGSSLVPKGGSADSEKDKTSPREKRKMTSVLDAFVNRTDSGSK
jgi:hypothetical protein